MTEKEMKKLNRYQLLELLILQSNQVNTLQEQLTQAQKMIDSRDIQMTVVGSIAEASVQLGGVLEAAQRTADIYLNAVQERVALIEERAGQEAERIVQEAREQAMRIIEDAEKRAKSMFF